VDLFSIGANAPPQPQWRSRLAAMGPPDLDAGPQPQNAIGAEALAPIVMQHLVRPVSDAFGYFGRTLRGEEPLYDPRTGHPSDEAYGAAGTLAGLGMTGGIGGTGPGGVALGAGPIRAYHGSPYDFERFDLSKIGTGEGAQAYGHGLYFAENEGVARSYRDALAPGIRVADLPLTQEQAIVAKGYPQLVRGQWSIDDAIAAARDMGRDSHAATLQEMKAAGVKPAGRMYEVGIHADPARFLDWDKPLGAQPAGANLAKLDLGYEPASIVQDAIKQTPYGQALPGSTVYRALGMETGDPALSSQLLREAGIPGIQYLDQGSRGAGAGSLNRVVFDDKLVEILRKYGLLGPVAGGAAASALPSQSTPEQ
jgi:hypothetical protein